jgi:hypothetical protein
MRESLMCLKSSALRGWAGIVQVVGRICNCFLLVLVLEKNEKGLEAKPKLAKGKDLNKPPVPTWAAVSRLSAAAMG